MEWWNNGFLVWDFLSYPVLQYSITPVLRYSITPVFRFLGRPHRLARPRTPAFHVGNMGSNPIGDAKYDQGVSSLANPFIFVRWPQSVHLELNLSFCPALGLPLWGVPERGDYTAWSFSSPCVPGAFALSSDFPHPSSDRKQMNVWGHGNGNLRFKPSCRLSLIDFLLLSSGMYCIMGANVTKVIDGLDRFLGGKSRKMISQ